MPCLKLLLKIILKTLAVWLIVLISNLDKILSKPCVYFGTKYLTMLIISLKVKGELQLSKADWNMLRNLSQSLFTHDSSVIKFQLTLANWLFSL